ncbi:MAG: DUF5658 family protein [Haloarculaceae archaeon]
MSVHSSNASDAPADWPGRLRWRLRRGRSVESALWALAVAAMLLDVGLTDYGLAMGFSEVNPIGRLALAALGPVGLLLAKLPVLALALIGWRLLPEAERWAVPLGLTLPWGAAVVLNVSVLFLPVP